MARSKRKHIRKKNLRAAKIRRSREKAKSLK